MGLLVVYSMLVIQGTLSFITFMPQSEHCELKTCVRVERTE